MARKQITVNAGIIENDYIVSNEVIEGEEDLHDVATLQFDPDTLKLKTLDYTSRTMARLIPPVVQQEVSASSPNIYFYRRVVRS